MERTEIITLRAIALKPHRRSTSIQCLRTAEIITLRAIALKHGFRYERSESDSGRDHNATSYSTETKGLRDSEDEKIEQRS